MASELDQITHTRLRRDGQRYTDNRRQLVQVLSESADPLTIPEILRRRDDLAQSSVYRNLSVLERAGVVQKIVTTDEWARYELAEDLTEHHHHLICSSCGAVRDFTVSPGSSARSTRPSPRSPSRPASSSSTTGSISSDCAKPASDVVTATRR